jgi:hypothetical protein
LHDVLVVVVLVCSTGDSSDDIDGDKLDMDEDFVESKASHVAVSWPPERSTTIISEGADDSDKSQVQYDAHQP